MLVGHGQSHITCIFLGLVSMPFSDTIWPKYSNLVWKNSHLEGFSFSPASEIFYNTNLSQWRCSSGQDMTP